MIIIDFWEHAKKTIDKRIVETIAKHYGIESEQPMSLAEIGRDFKITRERVRQLRNKGVRLFINFINENNYLKEIKKFIKDHLNNLGLRTESKLRTILLEKNFSNKEVSILKFIASIHPEVDYHHETDHYRPFFAENNKVLITALHSLNRIRKLILSKPLSILDQEKIYDIVAREIKIHFHKTASLDDLIEVMSVIKELSKNPFNQYGYIDNPYVAPKSINNKIYLLLKNVKKPMHFEEIKNYLDQISKTKDDFLHPNWQKQYSIGSITNALMNDPRFIFVGKGTYGLKEWNLIEGTAKEILLKILKKAKKIKKEILWQKLSTIRKISRNSFNIYICYHPNIKIQGDYVIYKK